MYNATRTNVPKQAKLSSNRQLAEKNSTAPSARPDKNGNEPCAPFKFSLVSLLGCTSNSAKRHCIIVSVVNTSEMQTNRVFRFFKKPKRFVVILPSYAVAMYYYVCARYAIMQQNVLQLYFCALSSTTRFRLVRHRFCSVFLSSVQPLSCVARLLCLATCNFNCLFWFVLCRFGTI